MASPRSSPSDGESAPGTPLLSPRSKLQAMLAAASDSEDDGSQLPSKSKSAVRDTLTGSNEAASASDDEDVILPRGRFASRMYESTQSTAGVATNPLEDARQRVKRAMQLDEPGKSNTEENGKNDAVEDKHGEDEDEDDDVPVAPRRRRIERESAPEDSPRPAPNSSPGLFVKEGEKTASELDSDSDLEDITRLMRSERFQAQVERKRQERFAREAEEKAKRAAAPESPRDEMAGFLEDSDGNESGITDDEGGHKLTQEVRPTRKAGRKAIEEMNRETQRMARNMQLAHQAKTKKKVTKATLFEKFNFRPAGAPQPKQTSSSRPATPITDVEMKDVDTPPSSPPTVDKSKPTLISLDMSDDEESPPVEQIPASSQAEKAKCKAMDAPPATEDKSKGKTVAVDDEVQVQEAPRSKEPPRPTEAPKRRVRVKLPPTSMNMIAIDSDDELTVTATKRSKLDAIFDKIPQQQNQESKSLHALRALAQVTSPGKGPRGRKVKAGMSVGEFQAMLAGRVREQARLEKERRLEILKAKGVVIQTEEERLRQIEEVEDLVARAREEAEEIMQRERGEAKKERKERQKNGDVDILGWDDSSDDDDYEEEPKDAAPEPVELELSGSEEEEEEDEEADDEADDEEEGEEEDGIPNPLFEDEAEDGESETSDKEEVASDKAMEVDEEEDNLPKPRVRRSKVVQVLSDDEDVVEATPRPKAVFPKSPAVPSTDSPVAPRSILRSATKSFIPGLPVAGGAPAGLGLTQMFAGTMDDSQAASPVATMQSPMPTFDPFSRPSLPQPREMKDDDDDIIMDSQSGTQAEETSQGLDLHFTQTEAHGLDSLVREDTTQASDLFDLTQDHGLEDHTPLRERFIDVPGSTISTVRPGTEPTQPISHDSPLVRKGRLRRRMQVVAEDDSEPEPEQVAPEADEFGFGTSAFGVMQEAAKKEKRRKTLEGFDRKKSKAKEMVEDQAEESEDEYAGLGGADGEDSDDDDLASVKDMIDDDKRNDVDERKLAALFAERDRADDEKRVQKLFKDITTGMLRRKRGADYDLDDSDDGGEARKRMKRRQFAKMQKALFADERVKKMAENPGNQAFLRTLEDHVSDDEMDMIDIEEPNETEESQSQSDDHRAVVPDSQPSSKKSALGTNGGNRPPAPMRRTKDGKKPSNLGEIRESLSSLLEEPHTSVIPATEYDSESGDDDNDDDDAIPSTARSDKENRSPPRQRRTAEVRDRISLKRADSSSSINARHAFTLGSTQSSFKGPALLRRATSNSFISSVSSKSSGTSTPAGAGAGNNAFGEKIKKGATRGSGINFDREKNRRDVLAGMQQRRTAKKMRGSEERLRAVSGLFGGGKFE